MMTELNKMLSNQLYDASDPQLVEMRAHCRKTIRTYNTIPAEDEESRVEILRELLGEVKGKVQIEPPFHVDYGKHIFLGDNVFMNFNCIILDCAEVRIGNNVMFGPNVQLYTAYHPLEASERNKGPELAAPITIEDNVWLGGGVIVCQNVTIGKNTTIGAGSVVIKDIPPNVFAAGNPCKVIKAIES